MLGIIVVIAVSWLLIWLVSREHISVLGIMPNVRRLKEFAAGFLLSALFCIVFHLWQSSFTQITYALNPEYQLAEFLKGVWWTLKAVLFEEFIYRGVVLYLLIKKIGVVRACLMDALIFGIYHWFSYGMFGTGLIPMTYVLLVTGAGGMDVCLLFCQNQILIRSRWFTFWLDTGHDNCFLSWPARKPVACSSR